VRRLRKKGVGIGKIARTLRIGASYVQRVVSETEVAQQTFRGTPESIVAR
jgi:hypothetical protein